MGHRSKLDAQRWEPGCLKREPPRLDLPLQRVKPWEKNSKRL